MQVKWNYSVLKLRRSAGLGVSSSSISIEFVDPDCLRTAARYKARICKNIVFSDAWKNVFYNFLFQYIRCHVT